MHRRASSAPVYLSTVKTVYTQGPLIVDTRQTNEGECIKTMLLSSCDVMSATLGRALKITFTSCYAAPNNEMRVIVTPKAHRLL